MPLYEYQCEQHGVFESSRAMAASSEPARCPACRTPAPRILSAVRGAQLAASEVRARERNERSRHEPRVVQRRAQNSEERPRLQRSHASRPWALEHG